MTIEEAMLDDRRFEELLRECHALVKQSCPEWTDAKVADPGITLIELFAWMTDMLSYRINRLPEKAHVALLNLLDVHLQPPRAARADLRLRLENPPTSTIRIPARTTEAATPRTSTQDSIVFCTSETFLIRPLRMSAYLLQGAQRFVDVTVSDGCTRPSGSERFAFNRAPQLGDCMLIGFPGALDRLVMRIEVECEPARGVGIDPLHPPLAWAASVAEEQWAAIVPLSDGTDGFNKSEGAIELELPARTARHTLGPYRLYWLRCELDPAAAHSARETIYTRSPEIFYLSAAPVGASVPAEHSQAVQREPLGRSDGTPGQSFKVRHIPVLPLADGERLETHDVQGRRWVAWERVETFADSAPGNPHYTFDESTGEVELGPAVRQPNGEFLQYGAIPAVGSELRFSAYRHGGGAKGNVAANTLTQLRRPIAGVGSVTNPRAATEGMDGESLANARARVAIEQRTRWRAITGADFEELCVTANERVARARCLAGEDGQAACLYIVPKLDDPQRALSAAELAPKQDLIDELAGYLNNHRLVGTSIALEAARYRAVSVVVQARAEIATDTTRLRRQILRALYTYLNPLVGGSAHGQGKGWPFGRWLKRGELYPIVEAIAGVAQITLLLVYETELASGRQSREPLDGDLKIEPDELIVSGSHRVRIEISTPQ